MMQHIEVTFTTNQKLVQRDYAFRFNDWFDANCFWKCCVYWRL